MIDDDEDDDNKDTYCNDFDEEDSSDGSNNNSDNDNDNDDDTTTVVVLVMVTIHWRENTGSQQKKRQGLGYNRKDIQEIQGQGTETFHHSIYCHLIQHTPVQLGCITDPP